MSDVVSFAEISGQQVELLPVRTLMQAAGGELAGGDLASSSDALTQFLSTLTSGGGGGEQIFQLTDPLTGGQ